MLQKDFQAKLGMQIAKIRLQKNMTQVELGHGSNIDTQNINRIEKGRTNPTSWTLHQIASALDVPLKKLFDWE